jgi:hypothetical protein
MKINKKILILILLGLLLGLAFYPSPNPSPNKYVERSSGTIKTEKVLGEKWLTWLYNNPVGEATMFTLVKRKFFSSWYGDMMESPSSAKKIIPFKEFKYSTDAIGIITSNLELPDTKYYGVNIKNYTKGWLEYRYIGGTDYQFHVHSFSIIVNNNIG